MLKKLFQPYVDYSAYIFKFWVNQITMSAMGLLVCAAVFLTEGVLIAQICLALFPVGFMFFLIYDYMFQFGHKHSVSIEAGHMEFDKLFGLKIYALAYSPTLLLILLTVIFSIFGVPNAPAITSTIYYLLNAFNLGFFWILDSVPVYVNMIIFALPPMIACTLGYYLGCKDKPISKMLGIKVKNSKK